MFGWLFSRTVDDILAETDVGEADILYAGQVNTPTRRKTVKELDEQGFEVTSISSEDIDELEDQTVFYRHKMFTSGMDDHERKETVEELARAEQENQELDIIQDPYTAWYHKDKNRTAELLEESFSGLENVRMAESFDEDEAYEVLEENELIAKPSRNCCGNGIKRIDEEEALENYLEGLEEDEYRLEEAVPHEEGFKDCRAIVLGDGEDATVLEVAARENGSGVANNISNGGNYTDPGDIFDYEIDAAIEATEGLDVAAFDYMKTPDGEIVGLEVNSDLGTAINEQYSTQVDVNQQISDYIASKSENEDYNLPDREYMDHLEVRNMNETDQEPASPETGANQQVSV